MLPTATHERATATPQRDLWQSVPLELAMSVFAILLAAGLKLAGVLP